jgi:hypothetical protein
MVVGLGIDVNGDMLRVGRGRRDLAGGISKPTGHLIPIRKGTKRGRQLSCCRRLYQESRHSVGQIINTSVWNVPDGLSQNSTVYERKARLEGR